MAPLVCIYVYASSASGPALLHVRAGCSYIQHATSPTTTDQLRIITGAVGAHDAAIITCVRAHSQNSFQGLPCPSVLLWKHQRHVATEKNPEGGLLCYYIGEFKKETVTE